MSKKNILVILPWLPYPLDNGGNQAMVNGLLAIKDDMNVFVIYMEGHKDSHSEERMKLKALLGNIDIKPCLNNRAVETRKAIFRSICSKIENKIFK